MHILVLSSFYPTPKRPILGIFFREQAQALHKAGHQVGVLVAPRINATLEYTRLNRRLPDLRTVTVENEAGLPVYRMHWGWFPRVFPRLCALLTASAGRRAFRRYVAERGQPDIIHAHNAFYSGYLASVLRREWGIPAVLTEHSSNFLRGRIFLPGQHRVVRETLHNVDAAFAVSPALAEALTRYAPAVNVGFLPNVADTAFFTPRPAPPLTPFIFAWVGLLIPLKRVDLLLRAFAQAFRGQPARLRIGGDGPERARLETLASTLGIQGQLEWLGPLSREQVRDLYQSSHVAVSASDVETFGVTLIESMACGRPVIATRSGGPEAFITTETGLLVPKGDIEAFATAMQTMQTTYNQYGATAIRDYCVSNFSETALVWRLEAIYQEAITRHGRLQTGRLLGNPAP